ncbi:Na(+)/H(+) antiporter NhaG [Bremerella volcania]|uniref:Na(+)/H(+) antiporter NhaG n=1 Tax=Bremerella volcania TaxID=2527984 RepID=A0A518C5Q7_9BACT|nr:sodium:proton antiporter [Bremerella volcania]QDU74566.1 Na(+)/H(+) antiporter NhaG [Bremerella volcania]
MTAETETVVVLLFVVASLVAIGARKFRLPYTVALILVGLALGGLQLLDAPQLTQNVLFLVFLPGLIFEAAFHIDFERLWRDHLAVLGLAIPGVAASIGITAALLVFASAEVPQLHGIGWALSLVFGAAVAATDPISVVSLFKEVGAPRRLRLLIEGESLLNDGTSIVFFTLVLALATGAPTSASRMVVDFGLVVGGGVAVGGVIGLLVSLMTRRIDDAMVEITLTTVAAYGSFLAAEKLGFSGVISAVAAGLICGNYGARTGMTPSTRVAVETFWEYAGFALNSLVFLLMGFQIRIDTLLAAWPIILIAYLVVTLARGLVVFGTTGLLTMTRARIPLSWSVILTWGGLRGALSMVLALSLPVDLPLRDVIVNAVFGVVLLTILVQGLTMTPLARWLGVIGGREKIVAYEVSRTRIQLANDVLSRIGQLRHSSRVDSQALDAIEAEYRQRLDEAHAELDQAEFDEVDRLREDVAQLRRRMLLIEKKEAIESRRHGSIGDEAFNQLLADINARFLELESAGLPGGNPIQDNATN